MTENTCTHCAKPQTVDGLDHPMVHLGPDSYHLDCLPAVIEAALREVHGELIDQIKADTSSDYAARSQWAHEHRDRLVDAGVVTEWTGDQA